MSETSAVISSPIKTSAHTRALMLGVSLCSFSALLLELGLTRLFSVVLFYHFAFLAISIALLGLGAGGVFAYLRKDSLNRTPTSRLLSRVCHINTIVIPAVLVVALRVPVSLAVSPSNFLRLTAMYLAAAVPFFMTGVAFSTIFSREAQRIPQIYGADLLGGALACIATVPLLNLVGGPNTILFSAVAIAVAGAVWSGPENRRAHLVLAAVIIALMAANYSGRILDVVYAKGVLRDRSWVEFAKWNAISRVEVDRQGGAKAIVIDADASTYIMNADPAKWHGSEWERNLMSAPPGLANVLRPHGDYAIIGPGGGVDVLRAVANGSRSVTGIEINPIIANTIMRGRYADFAYHLYERPDVHIHVTDGRSFIRNSKEQYDVVQMTLVDTWASTAAGAFALSENSLYTVEAFEEYFQHLRPDGMVVVTRWEFRQPREALRVVSVAMEALHRLGVTDTARNFIVVSQGPLNDDGIPVAVLAKKSPFTADEEAEVRRDLATYPALTAQYLPSEPGKNAFSLLIASNDPEAFARSYAFNVTPVFDNSPFFFFTLKLGQVLRRASPGETEDAIDWKVNLGVAVLGAVLLISIVAVLLFLILPLALRGGHQQRPIRLLYFVAIGLGYILVEIAFIQRFVLFLGHPTYALTVVIFLMLLSSGAGSLLSRRWLSRTSAVWIPLALIVAALAAYAFVLPSVLNGLVGWVFPAKLLVSAAILVPLGFAMGMPFPTGLRAIANACSGEHDNVIEWAWAMNAASSVLGSVLAIVIAIQFGLTATVACAAAAYLLSLLLLPVLRARAV